MNDKPEYLKLQTNIPVTVKFIEYDQPKRWDNVSKTTGKAYVSWSYLVEHEGKRYYLSIFDSDHITLKEFEPMKDKTLVLCKTEVGKSKELHVKFPTDTDFREGIKMAQDIAQDHIKGTGGEWSPEEAPQDRTLEEINTDILSGLCFDMMQVMEQVGPKAKEFFGANGSAVVDTVFMEYCKREKKK